MAFSLGVFFLILISCNASSRISQSGVASISAAASLVLEVYRFSATFDTNSVINGLLLATSLHHFLCCDQSVFWQLLLQ